MVRSVLRTHLQCKGPRFFLVHDLFQEQRKISLRRLEWQSGRKLYTIGCKGRKSHGYLASVQKRLGFMPAEKMKSFEPQPPSGDTSYDHVAELYDAAFADIRVRKDEWKWLNDHLPAGES